MATVQIALADTVALATVDRQRLRADAAASWDRAWLECLLTHGWGPTLTDSWRSYEVQERIFLERYQTTWIQYAPGKVDARAWRGQTWYRKPGEAAAAVPGTSNHGGGIAVDAGTDGQGWLTFSHASRTQWLAIARTHGWDDAEGRSVSEAWHITYNPANDQHQGEPMAIDIARLNEAVSRILGTIPNRQNKDGTPALVLTTLEGQIFRDDIKAGTARAVAETSAAYHQLVTLLAGGGVDVEALADELAERLPRSDAQALLDAMSARLAG